MARSVKLTHHSRTGLRRKTSEGQRKAAVELAADQEAVAREEQGTTDTVTVVSGETGVGTRTRLHAAIRGVPADGKDADTRCWKKARASPLRRAQRRCVLSGVAPVARIVDVTATAKTRTAGDISGPAGGVGDRCASVVERRKVIRAFPVAHLQHPALLSWDNGIRTLQANKLPQVVARFSRRVSFHRITLDSDCNRGKEEPGGLSPDRTTTSLPRGQRSPQEP